MSTGDPQNPQEHVQRIDTLSKYNISGGQTAMVALNSAADVAAGGVAVAGYSTIHTLMKNLKEIERNGGEIVDFKLKGKDVWNSIVNTAKERPFLLA